MLGIEDDSLLILDGQGETLAFPLDGPWQSLDPQHQGRALRSGDTLSIETVAKEWLGVDTFVRDQDQLVRTTHLLSRRLGNVGLRLRTVYERPAVGSTSDQPASEHPFVDTVGGFPRPATILIVPPERGYRELLSGRVGFQTLVVDPAVAAVEYRLDGRPPKRIRRPSHRTYLELDDPPREQTLGVFAYDADGDLLGTDRLILNRVDAPAAIHIANIRSEPEGGAPAVVVGATVSPPWSARLERVEFYRNESLVATLEDFGEARRAPPPQTIRVEALIEEPQPNDFVRVKATLADGRELEDAEILQGADYRSEIDVQLVQLQLLVTDRKGNPVSGLAPDDFEIREGDRRYRPEALLSARDAPLVLGLAIDSSDSMLRVWSEVREVAANFLDVTLAADDRAFLVDFDDTVSLRQPLTNDKARLILGIDRLIPFGGTAINDGILFSLLQYGREPGRRALVVVTDGADEHSRSRPEQSADYAARLGLPIYFIELDPTVTWTERRGGRVITRYPVQRQKARKRLERISRETGGRLFHVPLTSDDPPWAERIEAVFDRIEEELRNQYVLTYYSDRPLGARAEPEVRLVRRGLRLRSAVPLEGIE